MKCAETSEMSLPRFGTILATAAALSACTTSGDDGESTSPNALRSDPSASVTTTDPGVHLLAGFNAFLDRATPTECVHAESPVQPDVGAVDGSFYLRHVRSRDDLAKELDIDVSAALTVPQGSVDASTKIVKTFKQSSTTVTFLVRSFRSYVVSNRATVKLTDDARGMLERGAMNEFVTKCGGAFAQNVRYGAEVLALMQFEAKTEESAQKIRTSFGGKAGAPSVINGSASIEIKQQAEQTASTNDASLSLTVATSGFVSNGQTAGDLVDATFEKIDLLRDELASSWDKDIAGDRADYFNRRDRNVKPSVVGQASYAALSNAPSGVDYSLITAPLRRAEEFVRTIAPIYLRMEAVNTDEVAKFLSDQNNQFRYNLASNPQLRTSDLIPIAQRWAVKFGPDGSRQNGSLIAPLRMAIERCTSTAAGTGDYTSCAITAAIEHDKDAAETALNDYGKTGRIVPVTAWTPELGRLVSYRDAESECGKDGGRLPKRYELTYIAPAITALTGERGEAWFAADTECKKPYYANGSGQGQTGCADRWSEAIPFIDDRPVVCIARSGPIVALTAP